MDGANSPGQARAYWITPYAFEPSGGGLGVSLASATTTDIGAVMNGLCQSFITITEYGA